MRHWKDHIIRFLPREKVLSSLLHRIFGFGVVVYRSGDLVVATRSWGSIHSRSTSKILLQWWDA